MDWHIKIRIIIGLTAFVWTLYVLYLGVKYLNHCQRKRFGYHGGEGGGNLPANWERAWPDRDDMPMYMSADQWRNHSDA